MFLHRISKGTASILVGALSGALERLSTVHLVLGVALLALPVFLCTPDSHSLPDSAWITVTADAADSDDVLMLGADTSIADRGAQHGPDGQILAGSVTVVLVPAVTTFVSFPLRPRSPPRA